MAQWRCGIRAAGSWPQETVTDEPRLVKRDWWNETDKTGLGRLTNMTGKRFLSLALSVSLYQSRVMSLALEKRVVGGTGFEPVTPAV